MPATLLAPVGLQGVSNLAAHRVTLYLSCTCSDRSTRSWLPRPCQLRRTFLLPLPKIRLQPPFRREGHGSWKNSVSFCLTGRPDILYKQVRNELHSLVVAAESCGPFWRALLLPHPTHYLCTRSEPSRRSESYKPRRYRPCRNIPRRSRQLARHDVEIILTSLNLQGQSRGSVI